MKKNRLLNFELLRIISMLLIVAYHFSDWGGVISIETNQLNRAFGLFLNIGGKLGVNIFILITGYFMIDSKFKVKKLLKILLEILFYSVSITVFSHFLFKLQFNTEIILNMFFPINYNMYWFATAYIGLYILIPFLNKFINNLSKKTYTKFLIILGIILIQNLFIYNNIQRSASWCNDLLWFIYIYCIGGYINRYKTKLLEINKKKCAMYIILIYISMFLFSILCTLLSYKKIGFIKLSTYFNSMNSIPLIILSILIFVFFKQIEVKKYKKTINFFARTSFAVYLIHIHPYFRDFLFKNIIKIQNYYDENIVNLIIYICFWVLIIYLFSSVIETIRIYLIEKPLFKIKLFDKVFEKIDDYININDNKNIDNNIKLKGEKV